MSAHLQGHGLASTIDHQPGTNDTVAATEAGAIVEKAFGPTAVASILVERKGDAQITLPLVPSIASDAASKDYIDGQIVTGKTWKELLLAPEQLLSGASGAILQGMLVTLVNELTLGDTFIITDGTTTETFTVVGAPIAFGFELGGTAALTLAALVAAINTDSTLWSAIETTGLDDYFSGAEDPQFIVYRTAFSSAADRLHGVVATPADIQVVEFSSGAQDYRESSGVQSNLPATDPTTKRFGFARTFASLQTGDTHHIANDNTTFSWDGDDNLWQQTSTGSSTTEGDGIDVTGGKVTTDVAAATAQRKYGALTNRALSDGSALGAAADAGFNAVITDDVDLVVDSNNALGIKPASRLDRVRTIGTWTSSAGGDNQPTLAELNAALGTGAGDIGNWGILEEDGTSVASDSSFLVQKRANAGILSDYVGVEMSSF